jgi:CheY-like chemotaxis protein
VQERSWGAADLSGTRVLVLEDDDDARDLLTFALRAAGCEVIAVTRVEDAFKALRQQLPHIIVSDVGLPTEDGYSFMRRLRRLDASEGGSLPAIALTAFTTSADRDRAKEAGFDVHLSKPMHFEDLFRAFADCLGTQ